MKLLLPSNFLATVVSKKHVQNMSKANTLLIVLFIHFKIHNALFNPMPNQYINFNIQTMFHMYLTPLFYQFTLTIYDICGYFKISLRILGLRRKQIGALYLMNHMYYNIYCYTFYRLIN